MALGDDFAAGAASAAAYSNQVAGVRVFQAYDCPQWSEFDRKLPAVASNEDHFGSALALDDSWLAVGAPHSSVFGVPENGRVYLYERNQGGADNWGLAYTFYGGLSESNHFGAAVALHHDTLAVGLPEGDSTIFPNFTGQFAIHERNRGGSNQWGQVAIRVPSVGSNGDQFGTAIALWDDTVVVGAPENAGAGTSAGAAYVFRRNQGGSNHWGQVVQLSPGDINAGDRFGGSVAIQGDTAAVGAYLEDDPGGAGGAVYIFRRNQGGSNTWGLVRKLKVGSFGDIDRLGSSVAFAGDFLVAGAHSTDGAFLDSGAAYLFERNRGGPDNWGLVKKLEPASPSVSGLFGYTVAARGDRVLVGELYGDGNHGAVHLFGRNQGGTDQWGLIAEMPGGDAGINAWFGSALALGSDRLAIGAPQHDTGTRTNVGRIYLYEPSCLTVTTTNDVVAGGDGETSLREAIHAANASAAPLATVIIPEGRFPLVIPGSDENDNVTGDFDVTTRTARVVLQGQGARRTVLDGQDLDRVLHFTAGTTGEVRGLTIKNGRTSNGAAGTGANNGGNGRDGGGVYNNGDLKIVDCMIVSNTAGNGGSAQAGQGTTGGRGGRGGGIYSAGSLALRASTVALNATGYGGPGDTGGHGGDGGGVYDGDSLTVWNSTLWNNYTGDATGPGAHDGYGGGVFSAGGVVIRHSTIADNQAGLGLGGGLYVSSPSTFNFSVLDDNLGANAGPDGFGVLSSPSYNLISVTNGLTFAGSPLSNVISVLAQLGSRLTNALGPTDVLVPNPGSPVIDKGDAAFGSPLASDQRGDRRPTSGIAIDLGSVETTSDFDGDGVPDTWERAHGTDPEEAADGPVDLDGDGWNGVEEYVAGTGAFDASASFVLAQIAQTNGVQVSFPSLTGRVYSLQSSPGLVTGVWTAIAGQQQVPGLGGLQTLVHTNGGEGRTYRVMIQLPP